jgi:hypothetical protein
MEEYKGNERIEVTNCVTEELCAVNDKRSPRKIYAVV